jgi:hypothetical protein
MEGPEMQPGAWRQIDMPFQEQRLGVFTQQMCLIDKDQRFVGRLHQNRTRILDTPECLPKAFFQVRAKFRSHDFCEQGLSDAGWTSH